MSVYIRLEPRWDVFVCEPQWARLRRPGCWRWKRLCWMPWRTRLWRCMLLRVTWCRSAQVLAFWMRVTWSTAMKGLSCAATPATAGRVVLLWHAGSGSARLERRENSGCNISMPLFSFSPHKCVINNSSHLISSKAFVFAALLSWCWAELDGCSGPGFSAELASVETWWFPITYSSFPVLLIKQAAFFSVFGLKPL